MAHRAELLEFGAERGMNTYVYAPKDDPYHRARWKEPYPEKEWKALAALIRRARKHDIDFVYGFHPGKGLKFSDAKPVEILLAKAARFYDAGVRIFAVLFDDIPSRLEHGRDRKIFKRSLARAEGTWVRTLHERQPVSWKNVEWWICPSFYSSDPLLERAFGTFEPDFLPKLGEALPPAVACFWTGPRVVCRSIARAHLRETGRLVGRRLILWDNYPVNDLSMRDEMHLGPLVGRDPRLPDAAYGYLNNPLLQEKLSFIPLGTCFDFARSPADYDPEASWAKVVRERFGRGALSHWRALRELCEARQAAKRSGGLRPALPDAKALRAARRYLERNRNQKWAREFRSWVRSLAGRRVP